MVVSDPAAINVPPDWQRPEGGFAITTIDNEELRELYKRAAIEELQKYRLDKLKTYVRRVWIVGTLRVSGVAAIGSQDGGMVWVAIGSTSGAKYSEWDFRLALHHEVACQIFDVVRGGFPGAEWRAVSPDGYLNMEPAEAAKAGHANTVLSIDLARSGFLNEYAKSGVMKDFAAIHELSMMAPLEMCYLAERHDPLARKAALWKNFVARLRLLPGTDPP